MQAARTSLALSIVAAGLLLWPPTASSSTDEWRAHAETTGQEYQQHPRAALHSDGSWTAAWVDYRTGYPSIWVGTFDAEDDTLAPAIPLTDGLGLFRLEMSPSSVETPDLASLGDGRSLVVWCEERSQRWRIRALVTTVDGILSGPITVNESRPDIPHSPRVSVSGDRALVAWTEGRSPSSRIYAQVLDLSPQRVGGNFLLGRGTERVQDGCRIAPSATGWAAVWCQESPGPPQVLARAITAEGGLPGDAKQIHPNPLASQKEPTIAVVSTGFFVSWSEYLGSEVNLHGVTLLPDLSLASPPFTIAPHAETISPRSSEIVATDADHVLVGWLAGEGNRSRIHARQIRLPDQVELPFVVVDDPQPPPGQVVIPRHLALVGREGGGGRALWDDGRTGGDLVYHLPLDATGAPGGAPRLIKEATGTASQILPEIATSAGSGGILVWEDFRSGNLGIYGAFFDLEGEPSGSSFRISDAPGGAVSAPATNLRDLLRNRPAAVFTDDGYAVAAWTVIRPGGSSKLFYQAYDPAGGSLNNNIELLPANGVQFSGSAQSSPSFSPIPGGGYFLAWFDTCQDLDGDVFVRRYESGGTTVGDTIRVPDPPYQGASQASPAISTGPGRETVVVWLDDRRGNYDVYAQRLGPAGRKIQRNVLLSPLEDDTPVIQTNPDVSAKSDRYVAVWDQDPFAGGGVAGVLVSLPSSKDSRSQAEEYYPFSLAVGTPGLKYPRVDMAHDGRFVVVYWDTSRDSTRVMAQRFTSTASPIGPPYCVTSLGGAIATLPGDVAVDAYRIRFAFADSREGRSWDARIRTVGWRYDGSPTPVALQSWEISEEGGALVIRWAVPRDRLGSFYRIWREETVAAAPAERPSAAAELLTVDAVGPLGEGEGEYEFADRSVRPGASYAYWIEDERGELAGPWIGSLTMRRASLALRAAGNPFRSSVSLSWSSPPGGPVRLSIYDLAGRLVRTVLDRAGPHPASGQWDWDGLDDAGHPVASGCYHARLTHGPSGQQRQLKLLRIR